MYSHTFTVQHFSYDMYVYIYLGTLTVHVINNTLM